MRRATEILQVVETILYGALALAALARWRSERGKGPAWVAATFATLGVVIAFGQLLPDKIETTSHLVLAKIIVGVLVLFPYFLFRFAATFRAWPRWLDATAGTITLIAALWLVPASEIPAQGEPRDTYFTVFVAIVLVQWTALSMLAAGRLVRGSRGQAEVTRRRMWTLAAGAVGLAMALVISGTSPSSRGTATHLASEIVGILAAILFWLGAAPPQLVLGAWRRRDEMRVRGVATELLTATSPHEIAGILLPHVVSLVGAGTARMTASDGSEIGACSTSPEGSALDLNHPRRLEHPMRNATLIVEGSPYTAPFGREEHELVRSLADLGSLAMERAELIEAQRHHTDELARANEAIREFVAIASHDLRTPMSVIKGFADLLTSPGGVLSEQDRGKFLNAISRQSEHMSRIVEDLLTVSKIDAGVLNPNPVSVRVLEIVDETLGDLGMRDQVLLQIPPDLIVEVDRGHFRRMIANFVANAFNYGSEPVTIAAAQNGVYGEIVVVDSGPGVPEAFRPRLFERFARADKSASAAKQGTGLGLSIVRGFARAAGGEAFYEPNEPHGSRFGVKLPLRNDAA